MLLPALSKARAAAQAIKCKSNMKQMGLGYALYGHDYDDQVIPTMIVNYPTYYYWFSLNPIINNTILTEAEFNAKGAGYKAIAMCPSISEDNSNQGVGYRSNAWTSYSFYYPAKTLASFSSPSTTVCMFDGAAESAISWCGVSAALGADTYKYAFYVHSGRNNILFHDGHVDDITWDEGKAAHEASDKATGTLRWIDNNDVANIKSIADGLYQWQ